MLTVIAVAASVLGIKAGFWGIPAIWLGVDFLILAIAYQCRAHAVFGKRPDGTLPLWSWILFLPHLVYTQLVWHLIRLLSKEPACNEISETLVVGRRLLNKELPGGLFNYVDLTAEFQEPALIRKLPGYRSFPLLDAGAPEPQALQRIIASLKPGKTFVHCAQGHGRTGLFALATLVAARAVASPDEGLRRLQTARPGIRLNGEQRRCVDEFARLLALAGGSR